MKQAKHRYTESKSKSNKKKLLIAIFSILVIILISVAFIISSTYGNVEQSEEINETIEEPIPEVVEPPPEQFEIVDTSDLPDTYQGQVVLGKIVIDKIGMTQKILRDTTNTALKLGVTRYWGPDINEPRQLMFNRA